MSSLRGAALAALTFLALPHAASAQRRNVAEIGAAGSVMSFSDSTDLGTGAGGLLRVGFWLPIRLSIEGEGSILKPKTKSGSLGVDVKTISGSLLYNFMVGQNHSVYLKAGIGSTTYGSNCPTVGVICGTGTAWLGGGGFRIGITPTFMVRGEAVLNRNVGGDIKFSNFGGNLGLSVMLGYSLTDSDSDGVRDGKDKCPGTPKGAIVDKNGCPVDSDGDGVPDGLDRCPRTVHGAKVNAEGCAIDSDGDGVPDGLDKCPDTPLAAAVDANGCPIDSDGDGVYDGLDRCPDTPKGATVDALGCPSDTDGDGVLDGIDKCPGTPPRTPVDANGCPIGQPGQKRAAPPGGQAPPRPPGPPPPAAAAGAAVGAAAAKPTGETPPVFVLRDNAFSPGSARLRPSASPTLDSVAAALNANPALRVEIGGHTAGSRAESDSRQFASLRVEAVRSYLINKKIQPQRLVPKNYSATVPLTADTSATGRSINRRIEITPLAGP
ncbi:MAG TPA: thrombospondin type 3 repeat-containing protein [Gemmatimonadales bacterium]|nr:thrombospondin type 3 repeat-containing protein [Gemmatimonadales bacterium]